MLGTVIEIWSTKIKMVVAHSLAEETLHGHSPLEMEDVALFLEA